MIHLGIKKGMYFNSCDKKMSNSDKEVLINYCECSSIRMVLVEKRTRKCKIQDSPIWITI